MIPIRPVSDLRNKFFEIEAIVNEGKPAELTQNGYGAMVVLSLEEYENLTSGIEAKLDEADKQAAASDETLPRDGFQPFKERDTWKINPTDLDICRFSGRIMEERTGWMKNNI